MPFSQAVNYMVSLTSCIATKISPEIYKPVFKDIDSLFKIDVSSNISSVRRRKHRLNPENARFAELVKRAKANLGKDVVTIKEVISYGK